MRDVVIPFLHLFVTVVRLTRPGGLRSIVAESLILKTVPYVPLSHPFVGISNIIITSIERTPDATGTRR
jgi:hypothetical protein